MICGGSLILTNLHAQTHIDEVTFVDHIPVQQLEGNIFKRGTAKSWGQTSLTFDGFGRR